MSSASSRHSQVMDIEEDEESDSDEEEDYKPVVHGMSIPFYPFKLLLSNWFAVPCQIWAVDSDSLMVFENLGWFR